MSQQLKGALSIVCIVSAIVFILVMNWKKILVSLGLMISGIVILVLIMFVVAIFGSGSRGSSWDKD